MASEEAISAVRRSSQIQKEKIEVCCSPHSKCRRSDFFPLFLFCVCVGRVLFMYSLHIGMLCETDGWNYSSNS